MIDLKSIALKLQAVSHNTTRLIIPDSTLYSSHVMNRQSLSSIRCTEQEAQPNIKIIIQCAMYMVPLFPRPDDNSKCKDKGNMKTLTQTSTVYPDSIEARDSSDEEI